MKQVKRLAKDFKPERYNLYLHPNRQTMTFKGYVIIVGRKTSRPSKRLTFHQKGLKITDARVVCHKKDGDEQMIVDRVNLHSSYNELRLHTKANLFSGKYTITLEFSGQITKAMNGMYPARFKHAGKDHTLIATQFESHHAREVFPCIDEPDAKAVFELTLVAPKGETVISNTPIKKQVTSSKEQVTTFEETPRMSTYLLAFVYGNLKYKEAKTHDGVVVRAYATPENAEFTKFGLEVAVKCLEFYNDYFGISYPLTKCDLIALPDFASGAMENWGCITFREQAFLVDPANTSLAAKQYVAMVVAHELAHQWFGNLVTMSWWTDLWLNEGFASWIEYLAVDHIFPDWHMWTQFVVDEQQRALQLDALAHSHAIEVPVNHPDEIRTIFDTISYSKGSSVIHMLHKFLGKELFREGLSFYLSQNKHGNTNTTDLWQALEKVSDKPVREFMHSWTSQVGYPIVQVTVEDGQISIKQERFLLNKASAKHSVNWPIPLLAKPALTVEMLSSSSIKTKLKDYEEFRLNTEHSGFYRTVYNATHQQKLGDQISKGHLDVLDRLGLISDTLEAAKAGYTGTAEALQLLEHLVEEDNLVVWDTITASLASIRSVMDNETLRENMKPYIRKLTSKQLKRLGWSEKSGESHLDKLLRPTILGINSHADEPKVVAKAMSLWQTMKSPTDIAPDVRGVVFNAVARRGGTKEFEKLLKLHNQSKSSEERIILAAALCSFEQPALIKRALAMVKSAEVRHQDAAYWVAYSFGNRFAKKLAWQWIQENWQWLETNISSDFSFYRFPMYAARAFSDKQFLIDFKKFFTPRQTPMLKRAIDQGIETLEWQIAWKERDFKTVDAFFKNRLLG